MLIHANGKTYQYENFDNEYYNNYYKNNKEKYMNRQRVKRDLFNEFVRLSNIFLENKRQRGGARVRKNTA